MNDPDGRHVLVCVYYRVAQADSAHAISMVREFQRTLPDRFGELNPQVLLRCELPLAAVSSHASSDSSVDLATSSTVPVHLDRGVEDTVMETYRLALPLAAGDADTDARVQAFLDVLALQATGLAGMLRSSRHVEMFAPCAS